MPFRVTARTLLHLGRELISSDGIAFYELIKNAIDARSPDVTVRVVVRLPHPAQRELRDTLAAVANESDPQQMAEALHTVRATFQAALDTSAPDASAFAQDVGTASSVQELSRLLEKANYIEFEDTGEGMSLADLEDVYLTVGTRSRLRERERGGGTGSGRPLLGEKGVGRLSVMRLGEHLVVRSTKKGEPRWNKLKINWSKFSHTSDTLLEEIEVAPRLGALKTDPEQSGTIIRISALTANWSETKLRDIARDEFSRLSDPFLSARYRIKLWFNTEQMLIPRLDRLLFEGAHASGEAVFDMGGGKSGTEPCLRGKIDYRLRGRHKTFRLEGAHLANVAGLDSLETLRSLGPFKVEFYWFNRTLLRAIEGIGVRREVSDLVNQWAGGLMLFRDGFRVNPYGSPEDDWLALDKKALASSGYKVNRRQIIGRVEISSRDNPMLMDQTNREGLKNSPEKEALITLLRHILEAQFRTFLNSVDKEIKAQEPLTFEDVDRRFKEPIERLEQAITVLLQQYPDLSNSPSFLYFRSEVEQLKGIRHQLKDLARSYEAGRSQLLNLAGIGLMVEILAHELHRTANNTLATLRARTRLTDAESLFVTLESQFKTLQKRLQILDPMSTRARQTKEIFDMVAWVQEILQAHEAQFTRHAIKVDFRVQPATKTLWRVRLVRGMIVQVLENLISNSVYWLKAQQRLEPSFAPRIEVICDTELKEIRFTDNGPGISSERREEIFQPFVTTKPPGEGKGLGLFIAREIARYHEGDLYLLAEPTVHSDTLNTFVFTLSEKKDA